MLTQISGLHHVTTIGSDPRAIDEFWTGTLGLRRVKKTVNFDAPDVYHLYYGDDLGRPGTAMTYFPFPGAAPGRRGTGEVAEVRLAIPQGAAPFWADRLGTGVSADPFGAPAVAVFAPDGDAFLLVESDDPLEAGLEIFAQPPGKRLQSLTLLSGGEQALTAIALIFALFLTNPAPICVLDEVDAPLDDANIDRFCDLLDQMVRETSTRYLIVTHNAVTMSRMHRLFGVTMVEQGVSRLVSVDLEVAEELVAAE